MGHFNEDPQDYADDPKDAAQRRLAGGHDLPRPGDVYEHYKGGIYSVVCTSIGEASLTPLVTYRSNLKGTNWTRTLANFTETIEYAADNRDGPRPRFRRVDC